MFSHSTRRSWEQFQSPFSSVKAGSDAALYAATLGKGVFRKGADGNWTSCSRGLPQATAVNRLQLQGNVLYACTDQGLFQLRGDTWLPSEIAIPCFQYRRQGGFDIAATQYGIWGKDGKSWTRLAMAESIVYDVMVLPQYILLGYDKGIAMYDRFTDGWAYFRTGCAVTGLASFGGRVVGITEQGGLVVGNRRGGFDTYRFGSAFLFAMPTFRSNVYVCSDRGLYRLTQYRDQIALQSVRLGMPVTDVDFSGSDMHLATLFQGVQTVANPICQ